MPEATFKYDIFLSHASEDAAWCEKLAHRLREQGFRVWFDKWEVSAGDHLIAKINQGLEESAKMICIWTPNYFRADKVWTAVEAFSELHSDPLGKANRVIPILLDTCKIPPTLRSHIYVDCRGEQNIDTAIQGCAMRLGSPSGTYALWDSRRGKRLQARVEKIKSGSAVLRIKTDERIIQNSEVLQNFQIVHGGRLVYSGRATVEGVVDLETEVLCEVALEGFDSPFGPIKSSEIECEELLRSFHRHVSLAREFRTTATELRIFLNYLRSWCEIVECNLRNHSSEREISFAEVLKRDGDRILSVMVEFSARLDQIADTDGPQLRGLHRQIIQTEILPITMCAPFVSRSYSKPLGYAGDFEMVNFIFANPFTGDSLFAQFINAWMVKQPVFEACRVSTNYLSEAISREVARTASDGGNHSFLILVAARQLRCSAIYSKKN